MIALALIPLAQFPLPFILLARDLQRSEEAESDHRTQGKSEINPQNAHGNLPSYDDPIRLQSEAMNKLTRSRATVGHSRQVP